MARNARPRSPRCLDLFGTETLQLTGELELSAGNGYAAVDRSRWRVPWNPRTRSLWPYRNILNAGAVGLPW